MSLALLTAHPTRLEETLAAELGSLRGRDPLAPIAVIVGGTLLRPYLRRRIAELTGAHINVHFETPGEFGLRLAEPRMVASGRRPLSPLADRALIQELAREADGYFEPVRDTLGFATALGRLFRELRGADVLPANLSAAAAGPKLTELAKLYARYCEARSPFYDGADCVAALAADDARDLAVLVYGAWQLSATQRGALRRLAERIQVTVFLPSTNTPADVAHQELRDWLAAQGAHQTTPEWSGPPTTALGRLQLGLFAAPLEGAPDPSVTLLSAPDPNREAREAVRRCLSWAAQGLPLYEMAIVARNLDTYRQFVESACREAGVAVYVHSGTPLTERPLGRQVLALLGLIGSDLPRAPLMELLAELRLPDVTWDRLGGVQPTTWDRISRKAGVVSGLDEWRVRLDLYIQGQQDREDQQEADPDDAERLQNSRVDAAQSLLSFINELDLRFSARSDTASWDAHIDFLSALLRDYVEGSEPLIEALAPLAELDTLGDSVSFDSFREGVRATVEGLRVEDTTPQRPAAFATRGLNLLDVNSLRHVRFQAVAVLGLTERAFPPPPRQDPLLLDDEREQLNATHRWQLPLRGRAADPEPLQFALAVCAARERIVLSFARAEESGGRAKLPSSFLRSAAEALTGERVTADEIDALDPQMFSRLGAGRIGATELEQALGLEDYDRTLVEHDRRLGGGVIAAARPAFARARQLVVARKGIPNLTPYDGVLRRRDAREAVEAAWGEDRALSPTGLEEYATCPYRFFLNHVLGLQAIEEPEELERISALDRGTLVHRILERFLSELHPGRPQNRPGELDRLRTIVVDESDAVEQRGLTGYPLLWRQDRSDILADVLAWYRVELDDPDRVNYDDGDFEVRFGKARVGELTGRLSRDEPVSLNLAGSRLLLHGRIDRLEWRGRERFRVIDYKTGSSNYAPKDNALGGGTSLQLPVYMIAASELLAIPAKHGSAEYFFASRRGRFRRARFEGAEIGDDKRDVPALLGELVEGIRSGDFHAEPGENVCRFCDFGGVCDATRGADTDRKADDALRQRFEQRREDYP